jgi:hypothetical protein
VRRVRTDVIATLRESSGRYQETLFVIAAVMLAATFIPMFLATPTPRSPTAISPRSSPDAGRAVG